MGRKVSTASAKVPVNQRDFDIKISQVSRSRLGGQELLPSKFTPINVFTRVFETKCGSEKRVKQWMTGIHIQAFLHHFSFNVSRDTIRTSSTSAIENRKSSNGRSQR